MEEVIFESRFRGIFQKRKLVVSAQCGEAARAHLATPSSVLKACVPGAQITLLVEPWTEASRPSQARCNHLHEFSYNRTSW